MSVGLHCSHECMHERSLRNSGASSERWGRSVCCGQSGNVLTHGLINDRLYQDSHGIRCWYGYKGNSVILVDYAYATISGLKKIASQDKSSSQHMCLLVAAYDPSTACVEYSALWGTRAHSGLPAVARV